MRILPYRTSKNIIVGLVLTFLDISKIKEAEQIIQAARGLAANIVETVREPLLVLDDQLRVVSANPAFTGPSRSRRARSSSSSCTTSATEPEYTGLTPAARRDFAKEHLIPRLYRGQDVFSQRTEGIGAQWPAPPAGRRAHPGRILLAMEEVTARQGGRVRLGRAKPVT